MAVNFLFCFTKLTSRRQFGDKAYFVVMHETTTRHPRMPSSILSYSESPPPICLTSSQHVNPRDVRASYSFFTCGCFPHWYEMNTSGETVTCEDKFVNYFFFFDISVCMRKEGLTLSVGYMIILITNLFSYFATILYLPLIYRINRCDFVFNA